MPLHHKQAETLAHLAANAKDRGADRHDDLVQQDRGLSKVVLGCIVGSSFYCVGVRAHRREVRCGRPLLVGGLLAQLRMSSALPKLSTALP